MQAPDLTGVMSSLFWLTDAQMTRLRPFFRKSHDVPRIDDPVARQWFACKP